MAEIEKLTYSEIEEILEAIRIRKKLIQLEDLKLKLYSNMQNKKHYKSFENAQQKLINEIKFGLGIGIKVDKQAVENFKKARHKMIFNWFKKERE